ncbi:ECF RNA polymerase sigma factor SigW [Peptococcaceae bacterium CEB3]|nr:ECF RNA polymerase sigma factor SigW [Peptococcaceae bacterium CEB3]
MPTDDALVEEILNGSQAAMEVLVKRHYREIFAYVYRKTGDYHTSYDLTQDILIKMMKGLKSYRRNGRFRHWLLKIAVNQCRDYYRSSEFQHRNAVEPEENLVDEGSNVWDIFRAKQVGNYLKETILTLPAEQREVIVLRFYHDLKMKDIAQITECKETTAKSRLRQGLAKLRKALKDDETFHTSSSG